MIPRENNNFILIQNYRLTIANITLILLVVGVAAGVLLALGLSINLVLGVSLATFGVMVAFIGLICLIGSLCPGDVSLKTECDLDAPIELVWKQLVDIEAQPQWNTLIIHVEKLSEHPQLWRLHDAQGFSDIKITKTDHAHFIYELELLLHRVFIKLPPFYNTTYLFDIKLTMTESITLTPIEPQKTRITIASTAHHGLPKVRLRIALLGNMLLQAHQAYYAKLMGRLATLQLS